jgi:ketosteroid isomerase-like protein
MSQQIVDVLRESIERFNRGDIAGVLRLMDSDIRFEHRQAELQGSFRGVDAVKGWFADLREIFENARIDCDDFRDLGDRVLALGTLRAIGTRSGAEVEAPYTAVASFENGLITHFIDYGDKERALEVAGLLE